MGSTPQQEQLAAYVLEAARRAGYDMDSPRGGGKTKLANDSGMSLTTLSRLLSGERMPDAKYFAPLAEALKVPATDLLVAAGILSIKELHPLDRPEPTPEQAFAALGITEPEDQEVVRAMIDRMRELRNAEAHGRRDPGRQRGVGGHPRRGQQPQE